MVNMIEYKIGLPAEELEDYSPGGYHPIHLNDTLHGGRYEIVHKLGYGSFATVWLARDHHDQRNVTIKVVVANKSDETSRELEILRALKERGDPTHPGRKHITQLIDCFHHDGPNGRHLCLVLGLLGPKASSINDECPQYRLDGLVARSVSRQLLLAVDYLYSAGIAHGDIHAGNVLFCVPELESAPLELVLEDLGPPVIGKIERRDGGLLEPGMPEYFVQPAEFSLDLDDESGEVELIDFGESFFIAEPPKQISTPASLHPPELILQHPLSSAVDIWNLGFTTYELVTGRAPFLAFMNDQELIPQIKKVLGDFPEGWIPDALTSGVLKEAPNGLGGNHLYVLEEQLRRSYLDNEAGKKSEDQQTVPEDEKEESGAKNKDTAVEKQSEK
ncbi:protein kinase dsk1 [Staphylotrichum tortipilum]|uniref:non-specific serine/threonine protein kinase n=1 Tax=Staphylotrichum tortipilum TaxID=2831512 RepID=A0AAN6M9W2_9PEZI|nr:protein kinase dsk1 [Staphylotrichum longicolle]